MIQRHMAEPGIGCHSFRETGSTYFLEHGGTLQTAARIAGHASTKTTQLYDRCNSGVEQGEIERIRFQEKNRLGGYLRKRTGARCPHCVILLCGLARTVRARLLRLDRIQARESIRINDAVVR